MIFRVEKTDNYTVMSNFHFRNKDMTLKAKGLLSLILSLPDGWDYSIKGLVAICKENETAVKSALKELKQFGYLEIKRLNPDKTDTGRFGYEYIIYEIPKQEIQKQGVENLPIEIQAIENQAQLNTKRSNTNISITKDIISYLNDKTNRRYRPTDKVNTLIGARLKEGFIVDDFYKVIDNKASEWLSDPVMNKYLRPETLFSNKFQGYLNQTQNSNNPFRDRLGGAV